MTGEIVQYMKVCFKEVLKGLMYDTYVFSMEHINILGIIQLPGILKSQTDCKCMCLRTWK